MNPLSLIWQLCASLSRVICMLDDVTSAGQSLTRTAKAAAENYEVKTSVELQDELEKYVASLNSDSAKATVTKVKGIQL